MALVWTREVALRFQEGKRGFVPVRRGPFVSAKGLKTMDAPSGLMGGEGRQLLKSGPTRSAQTRSATCEERPSLEPAGRRRSIGEEWLQDLYARGMSGGRMERGRGGPTRRAQTRSTIDLSASPFG